jgi:Flp pilus assembly protein TadG
MPSTALPHSTPPGRTPSKVARAIRALSIDRRGAAAVEFALISSMLICTILFIMTVGVILYMNQALDYATSKAARQVMTGSVQKSGTNQSDFRTQVLCPYLPAAMSCNDVIVNVQSSITAQPGWYSSFVRRDLRGLTIPTLANGSAQYDTGVQQSYVYMQVIYPITFLPSFLANVLGGATYNGSPAYLAMSTAAFRNEQY